jgi:hypothetical protein
MGFLVEGACGAARPKVMVGTVAVGRLPRLTK